jgi:outer membrane receptor protein involved in Fe transport
MVRDRIRNIWRMGMLTRWLACVIAFGMLFPLSAGVSMQQPVGSIRGVVYDDDFDAPLAGAQVLIVETGQTATTTDEGNFVVSQVPPGKYTLVFSKEGYARQVRADVVVSSGQLTDVDMSLPGEFTEMEEFVVQDIQIGGAEAALLKLRMDSPALIDSISADLMSRAGASDAASALRLVSGATVQDGKFAVIRGLPDRYVSSQMNGVRLPTADEDKRAVELDQFPAAVIDSIQVSKTFTPDQQGDASGGAVNVVLKSIPVETIFQLKSEISFNSQVVGSDFLTYDGGGVNFWERDDGDRDIQLENLGGNWDGAAGISRGDPPTDYKWSAALGGRHEFDNGVTIGGFASFFYERDSAFFDNGIDDSYWVTTPGAPMTPETIQGTPSEGDFKTKLFDVTEGTELVQWGGLGAFGVETEHHSVGLTYLYTRTAEDTATLAEDTRGKEFFFPGYDPDDPTGPGNLPADILAAPYIRTETLQYTERTTQTLQLHGKHTLPTGEFGLEGFFTFLEPELDWTLANSTATLDQPDKRQFGSLWHAESFNPGIPGVIPPFTTPALHLPFKPAANFTLGNFQRIWKDIEEESDQYAVNLKLPFEQWSDSEGYLKFGVFDDQVTRQFNQDTFSNFNDNSAQFLGDFDDFWSAVFPFEDHPITDGPPFVDVDYDADQEIAAWYAMMDLPLTSWFNVIGGARFESTDLSIVNIPEADATWFPPGALAPVILNPGDADVDFSQDDVLPSIGFVFTPLEQITFRGSYSETVARQTFKELTPILQQEFLGGPIFIGNPDLRMSALENYDLRLDYTPYEGGLVSASWFKKDVEDPIEYVQRVALFTFTTPVNYPRGELSGFELEVRQHMGQFWNPLQGLSLGANATFIDSEVTLPDDEAALFEAPNVLAPMPTRDMTGAPEHLYNLYLTYDLERTGTQFALFYTVQGDTLVTGAGVSSTGQFVPNVYALEYGTLNLSLSQKIGEHFKLQFQAKNLTNPEIEEVYRSEFIGSDVTRTSYTRGIEFSIGLSAEFTF